MLQNGDTSSKQTKKKQKKQTNHILCVLQSLRQSNSIQALFPCFHMNLQASGHQPRDVARGANEEMIAP